MIHLINLNKTPALHFHTYYLPVTWLVVGHVSYLCDVVLWFCVHDLGQHLVTVVEVDQPGAAQFGCPLVVSFQGVHSVTECSGMKTITDIL